ncbi:hypothetical protein [Roseixanthobacter liquoris]|uniref:hypothetical protein n=1 Tax=Roseixanthobacter liquoris TaxID=3119921 RepID=UPI003728810B
MRKLIFESSIYVPEGDAVLDQICDRLIDLCTGISRSETDLYLIFEVGRSIIRVGHGALLMRVEADDLVGCHSMKVALEGTVVEIFGLNQPSILWIATNSEPFAALAVHPIRPRI